MGKTVRPGVVELARRGRLPADSDAVNQSELDQINALLLSFDSPLTVDEVRVLIKVFPEDASVSYGFAWTLLHMIEHARTWPDWTALRSDQGWWSNYLAYRLQNGGVTLPDDLLPRDIARH